MKNFVIIALCVSSFTVYGHGEKSIGPHGGAIQMPGAFHTELVLEAQRAKVYLLDMNFKNPTTENSHVILIVVQDKQTTNAICEDRKIFFECRFSQKLKKLSGIRLKAKRQGVQGKEAFYPL